MSLFKIKKNFYFNVLLNLSRINTKKFVKIFLS